MAGLDWTVSKRTLKTEDGVIIDSKAIMRDDINTQLGITSDSYTPLQNTEAFKFFEPFIENDLATLETAGSLFNGRIVFILAKINSGNMVIQKGDEVEKYILLSNSHTGGQAVRVGYTPIRVVCNNTLSYAESSSKSNLIRVHHRPNLGQTMEAIHREYAKKAPLFQLVGQLPCRNGSKCQ